ncbi:MAG: archaeosine synthase beta-subunit [Verrucomicrobiota bacterium]|jgi:radical SAM enzyme (TIGR01210 family)
MVTDRYPESSIARDQWVLARRPGRHALDPRKPHAYFLEEEPDATGRLVSCGTIFLTNRECPWRCVMCDLWRNTLTESVPVGAIPAQIDFALGKLGLPGQIKLYNSGSFFDPRAIPPEDHAAIALQVRRFNRVIVECHPAFVGQSSHRFRDQMGGKLEVAMGLETAHPQTLEQLNKRMTLDQFRRAADFLRQHDIALRVFILVQPPFLPPELALHWAQRSIEFAFDCGADVASLIPTRTGNGALEALQAQGKFVPPRLQLLEACLASGLALRRGRVFADLWDLEKFSSCATCFSARRDRLARMNRAQIVEPEVSCAACTHGQPLDSNDRL